MPVFPSTTTVPDAGDLLELEYQYQLGTWLGGAGTPFVIENVSGLLGHSDLRVRDIDKDVDHGSIPVAQLFSPRTIQFDIKVSTQIDYQTLEDLLDLLSDNFQPDKIRGGQPLRSLAYWRPGRERRQFFGRPTKFDADSDYKAGRGLVSASVEFVANDPISYALENQSESVTLGVGETSDQLTAVMSGNCKNGSPPLIYVAGTCTNPRIDNAADDSREIKLDINLAANQTIRIDVQSQMVEVKTGAGPWVPRWDIVRDDNQWWHIMPGDNDIVLSRTGSSAGCTLTVEWFDAWARG